MRDWLIFIGLIYGICSLVLGNVEVLTYFDSDPKGKALASSLTGRARIVGYIIIMALSILWFGPFAIYVIYKSCQELFQGLTKESPPNLEHTFEQVDFTIKETEQLLQKVRTE